MKVVWKVEEAWRAGYLLPLMGTVAPGSPLRPQGQPPCLAPGPECWWRLGLACIGQTEERPRLLGVRPHHPGQQHLCRNSPTPEKKTSQSKLLLGARKKLAPSEFWCGQAELLAMSRNLKRSKHCILILSITSPMSWIQGRESLVFKKHQVTYLVLNTEFFKCSTTWESWIKGKSPFRVVPQQLYNPQFPKKSLNLIQGKWHHLLHFVSRALPTALSVYCFSPSVSTKPQTVPGCTAPVFRVIILHFILF